MNIIPDKTNEPVIRAAFEAALVRGLTGEPLTNKDGDLVKDNQTGETILAPPDSSFLSVVRAYLKDLVSGDGKPKVPQTGKPQGLLASMGSKAGLPFGQRPQ